MTSSIPWEKTIRNLLDNEVTDFGNLSSLLVDLFEGVVMPDIFLTHANKVAVQQIFSVRMGGSKKLGKLLCQPDLFCSLPTLLQKGILDLLYVILRRGTYDVTRFQYRIVECNVSKDDAAMTNEDYSQSISLNKVLLDLLHHFYGTLSSKSSQQICEKIILLLGVTFTAGCTSEDLKEVLFFLRTPSTVTLPLLQTMKCIIKQDNSMTKASPSSFFSFGGHSSGIYSVFGPFPFTREYQFFTWFRIDKFENSNSSRSFLSSSSKDAKLHSGRQHIISVVDSSFHGIDVYIEQNLLTISISDSKTPATLIRFGNKDVRFTRGVWYHIAVRHSKPRLSLFSKDEMAIYIDRTLVFQDFVRFPSAAHIGPTSLVCGRNFNGQIGPVYFLTEALPFPAVEAIARLDVGKSGDSSPATNEGFYAVIAADLLQSINTADRKVVNIAPKFTSVFHPARCKYGHALDVHSGRHAVLGPLTFTWVIHTARDVLEAMGGIACLLIMFPKLLIEGENAIHYLGPRRPLTPDDGPIFAADGKHTNLTNTFNDLNKNDSKSNITSNNNSRSNINSRSNFGSNNSSSNNMILSSRNSINNNSSHSILEISKNSRPLFSRANSTSIIGSRSNSSDGAIENANYLINTRSARNVNSGTATLLDDSLLGVLEADYDQSSDSGCVGLLLSIIAHTLAGHRSYQRTVASMSAIEMIEFVMKAIPGEIMCGEGDGCILALLQLRSAVTDYPALELRVTRRLICNFAAWTRCTFQFQSSLLSVVATSIRSQPEYFSVNLGVQGLLDALRQCFMDVTDTKAPSPAEAPKISTHYRTLLPQISVDRLNCESPHSPIDIAMKFSPFFDPKDPLLSYDLSESSTLSSPNLRGVIRRKSLLNLLEELTGESKGTVHLGKELADANANANADVGVVSTVQEDLESTPSKLQALADQVFFDKSFSAASDDSVIDGKKIEGEYMSLVDTPKTASMDDMPDGRGNIMMQQNLNKALPAPILDRNQRKHLRGLVFKMIMSFTQHFASEREIRPFFHFISCCKDGVVLVEISQLLLRLLVEGGSKIISVITEVCGGPEEFAAFIIQKMIKSPHEDLRCIGIRLLTHFYLRVDLLPVSLLVTTLKRRKGSILTRTMEKISMIAGGVGMRRLHACGGFTLLEEALSAHSESSTDRTYAVLLEMLLTKANSKNPATVQYPTLSDEYATSSASLHLPSGTISGTNPMYQSNRTDPKAGGPRERIALTLTPEQVIDEGVDLLNAVALSFVLDSLPKLPITVQGQIYRDISSLLHYSTSNKEVFRSNPSWHASLFSLVSNLMSAPSTADVSRVSPEGIITKLGSNYENDWIADAVQTFTQLFELQSQKEIHSETIRIDTTKLKSISKSRSYTPTLSIDTFNLTYDGSSRTIPSPVPVTAPPPTDEMKDSWYSASMQIYANLLSRAMDTKAGWREVERTLCQSLPAGTGTGPVNPSSPPTFPQMVRTVSQRQNYFDAIGLEEEELEIFDKDEAYTRNSVARCVLSHLISDMTISIRVKYKDLQRLARSSRFKENQAGLDRMENILTLILSASQFFLADDSCVSEGVGDLHIGRLRAHYYNEVIEEKAKFDQLVLESKIALQSLGGDVDVLSSEGDAESSSDCSCMTSAPSARKMEAWGDELDRLPFSPLGVSSGTGTGYLEASPLSQMNSEDLNVDAKERMARVGNYFDLAEDRLMERCRCDRYNTSPVNEDDPSQSTEMCNSFVNFSRSWMVVKAEVHSASGGGGTNDGKLGVGDGEKADAASPKNNGISKSAQNGDLRNPLKRCHDPDEGKICLVLQTLHLFDALFWPNKSGPLRNKHMLRFVKDQVQVQVQSSSRTQSQGVPFQNDPVVMNSNVKSDYSISQNTGQGQGQGGDQSSALSSSSSSSLSINPNANYTGIPFQASRESPKVQQLLSPTNVMKSLQQSPSISLYTAVVRMSLNALQTLSPLSELASLNVRRLHELILSQDKVSPYTTPVDDWLLAAVLHVTVSLQRVVFSLSPIFNSIHLDAPILNVALLGAGNTIEVSQAAALGDNEVFSHLDEVSGRRLSDLFESQEAAALCNFSRDCMKLLVSVVRTRRPLLEKAMEPRICAALVLFADKIAEEYMASTAVSGHSSSKANDTDIAGTAVVAPAVDLSVNVGTSAPISSTVAFDVAPPDANARDLGSCPESPMSPMKAPLSMMKNWYSSNTNTLGDVSPNGLGTRDAELQPPTSKSPATVSPVNIPCSRRDHLGEIDADELFLKGRQIHGVGLGERGVGGYNRNSRRFRSESEGSDSDIASIGTAVSDGTFLASTQGSIGIETINATYFTEMNRYINRDTNDEEVDESQSDSADRGAASPALRWLKLMRNPYLKLNALRSVGIVKSVTALEHHEVACAKGFSDDLLALRGELEELKDASRKSAEEMTELRELSSTIISGLSAQERTRQASNRSNDSMLLKKVAANWHDCLSTFEMDWSPWADIPGSLHSTEGAIAEGRGCKIDGISLYEISEHRDSRMRRMILTRAADPTDHRESAYREGKHRLQNNPEFSRDSYSLKDHSASFSSQRATFLQRDLSKMRTNTLTGAISGAAWGDDADLTDGNSPQSEDGPQVAGSGNVKGTGGSSGKDEVGPGTGMGGGMGIIGGLGALVFTSGNSEKRPDCSYVFQWAPEERMQAVFTATQVQLELMISGVLVLTSKALYFHPNKIVGGLSTNKKPLSDHRWLIDRLLEAYGRRFVLKNCAIELFFADSPEVYFAFSTLSELQRFFRCLKRQNVPNLRAFTSRSLDPRMVFANSPWTDLWRRRLISNFEYLMRLNILAGRSYNDITQYPVFPWIIADYTSQTLDLTDPKTFRDLSKPVGALNPIRLEEIKERYDSFDSDIMPPFMYGSHYSSAGVVIHYMMRQEPFTTMFVNLQGGKFDCPDRVFFDLKSTWDCCNKDRSDVKELIPELFCCPESLLNTCNLPLGELQEGRGVVNDVLLPPWAQGDAFEFVRLHREALESDYVSEHLHEWIDLIFGFKQTGPASVLAHNVFHYLSYEDAVDIDAIEDPIDREAAKGHVTHFGQTPAQLLNKEHLPRLSRDECMVPLCSDIYNISRLTLFTPPRQLDAGSKHGAVISVRSSTDRLIVIHADLSVSYYRWSSFPDGEGSPFQMRPEKSKFLPCSSMAKSEIELRRKSFVPIPPIDPNMQRCPQVSVTTPNQSPVRKSKKNFGSIEEEEESDVIVDLPVQPMAAAAPSTRKDLSRTSSAWSFFGSMRRNLTTQPLASVKEVQKGDGDRKPHGRGSIIPMARANSNCDFDDFESDAEFEDDEDDESMSREGDDSSQRIGSSKSTEAEQLQMMDALLLKDSRETSVKTSLKNVPEGGIASTQNIPSPGINRRKTFTLGQTASQPQKEKSPYVPLESSKLPDINCRNIALSVGELGNGRVVSCGYWDNSLKVHALDSLREVASVNSGHLGEIVCVQLGYQGGHTLITGGADGTVRVWILENPSLASSFSPEGINNISSPSVNMSASSSASLGASTGSANNAKNANNSIAAAPEVESTHRIDANSGSGPEPTLVCAHVLCGHNSPVTAISYATDLDIVLSGSQTGLLCLHAVRQGTFIRSITHILGAPVDLVLATSPGYLIAHSWSTQNMHVFWVNGQHRATVRTASKVETMAVNGPSNVLVCGHSDGRISLRAVWNLQQTHIVTHSSHGAIKCLSFTEDYQFLLIGSADGTVSIGTDPDVRWKMLHAAIQKTPLLGPTL